MRPIDADALSYRLEKRIDSVTDLSFAEGLSEAIVEIGLSPTLSPDEVRGVVHCGECKFWRRPPSCEGLARCETGETGIRYRSKNDFCSRGAKMEVSEDA